MYKLNHQTLEYVKVNQFKFFSKIGLVTVSLTVMASLGTFLWTKTHIVQTMTEYEKVLLVEEVNQFSEDKMVEKIKELGFKYPHIVMAQAILETGNFKSPVFQENHNLFGMKEATSRLNLAKGTQNNHASYSNWEDSVMDYALWCSTYANKAQSEDEYFQILNSLGYAEDGTYEIKLKEVIQKYDLKNKFS
jgi:uncharacterized FlgJ-related protein